jgi:hypothetical protein
MLPTLEIWHAADTVAETVRLLVADAAQTALADTNASSTINGAQWLFNSIDPILQVGCYVIQSTIE